MSANKIKLDKVKFSNSVTFDCSELIKSAKSITMDEIPEVTYQAPRESGLFQVLAFGLIFHKFRYCIKETSKSNQHDQCSFCIITVATQHVLRKALYVEI